MSPERLVLIIVHGMGQQRRNDSLLGVVRPMLELMEARGARDWKPDLRGSLAFDQQATAEVDCGGKTWHFAEYWWAEEFRPAKAWVIGRWIFKHLAAHLVSMLGSMRRGVQDLVQVRGEKDPFSARLYHFLATPVFMAMVAALFGTTWLLVLLLVALQYVSLVPGVPSVVGYIRSLLQVVAVDFIGDIYVYFRDPVQAAQIRGGLQDMVEQYAKEPDVKRIVILAHSTGNLLVYDALAQLHESDAARVASGSGEESPLQKVVAFVSIGSILNMAWNRSIVDAGDRRFRRGIADHIHWYHLWTRYDIGPAGPIKTEDKPWISEGSLVNRRVNNFDDLLLDHTGYWGNLEQVHSLLLEEMGGLDDGNDFWRGPGLNPPGAWQSRSTQAWADFALRRSAVAQLAFVRLLTWPVPVIGFPIMLWFDGWARGIANFFQSDWLAGRIGFAWLETNISGSSPSGASTIGMAALVAAVLFALAFLVVYIGFKQLWWNRNLESRRAKRSADFMADREMRRSGSST